MLLAAVSPHPVPTRTLTARLGPVGTAITITDLFSQIHVRKHGAEKAAAKTLLDIKALMQSYALARLNTRLSLKVLKNAKSSWSYAPRPETGVKEAVLLVFGPRFASQCIFKNSFGEHDEIDGVGITPSKIGDHVRDEGGFCFEACLPKLDVNVSKPSKGTFVSIDSRPVSSSRGIPKKLLSLFRAHFNRAAQVGDSSGTARELFLRLNIICPPNSYDPNIEPAKDDVCFVDEGSLISQFESFLRGVYPLAQQADSRSEELSEPTQPQASDCQSNLVRDSLGKVVSPKQTVSWYRKAVPRTLLTYSSLWKEYTPLRHYRQCHLQPDVSLA